MEKLLNELRACDEAKEWAKGKDWKTVYETCERGDWLLWLFYRVNSGDKRIFLAKAHCANTVRHLMKDERSLKAIDAAIKFANGEITEEERAAYATAAASAYAAAASAAAAAYAYADAAAAAAAAYAYADAAAAAADASAYAAAASASAAAYAYADAAAADASAYAAAASASAAAYAYADAAAASASAAAYAYADAADAARIKNRKETADICRKYLPFEIWNIK